MRLNKKQSKAFSYFSDQHTNEILYGGAAGGGKSILLAFCAIRSALKYPKSKWLLGRSVLKTLRETTLKSFFLVCDMQKLLPTIHYEINHSNHKTDPDTIKFFNGSTIHLKELELKPSDPNFDRLGSLEITGAFIDEVSQVSKRAWGVVQSRIRHDVTKNGLVPKILGTCNPSKGWLYSEFYKPFKKELLSSDKAFIQALVTDNPDIDKTYIKNLSKLDTLSRRRLLDGDWDYEDGDFQIMSYDKIVDSFSNLYVLQRSIKKYITIDVARKGKDASVVRVWQGLASIERHSFDKNSITELAQFVRALAQRHMISMSNIIADEDGVGGGVVDILKCRGFLGGSRPIYRSEIERQKYNYLNLRSQCFFKLAEEVEAGNIYLSDKEDVSDKVAQELSVIERTDSDQKAAIVSKDIMKEKLGRSPDDADSIMMRMYFELAVGGSGLISAGC